MTTAYKTAAELGITSEEHAALIATIDVLREEGVRYNQAMQCGLPGSTVRPRSAHPCKTSCCIGGTMSLLMQNGGKLPERVTPTMMRKAIEYVDTHVDRNDPLEALFWANTSEYARPRHGIRAIENFLGGNTASPWAGIKINDDA